MEHHKQIKMLYYFSGIIIFLLSTLSHFAYNWSNYNEVVGMFTPTNESIFQHLKMIFFPIVLYYLLTYIFYGRKYNIVLYKWLLSAITTFIVTSTIIVSNYYIFTYGFSISNAFIDISALLIGLFTSSLLCIHLYIRTKNHNMKVCNPIVIIGLLLLVFTISFFDKNPLKVDLFYDNENNTYNEVKY